MSDIEYIIRDYQDDDYSQVIELWEETDMGGAFRGDDESKIRDTLKVGGKLLVMEAINENIIIGTSWLTNDGRRIYLHHFGIKPEYQGRGLSKPLTKASIDFAKEKGLQIKLEVHRENKTAVDLYKKFGFKYLGDYDVYIIRKYIDQ